jgi:hypothetical protein
MPTLMQMYQWLREHPCGCDVDKAERCCIRPIGQATACGCKCHAVIAEYHNDRTYSTNEYPTTHATR